VRQTYVFEGTEVIKTGRVAVKQRRPRSASARVLPTVATQNVTLVEITPLDSTFDWKKWVTEEALYIVEDNKSEE